MKKLLSILLVFVFICSCAYAETEKTFEQSSKEIVESFNSFMYALHTLSGVDYYGDSYKEEYANEKHFILLVNRDCSLNIDQSNGKATKVSVITHDITDKTNISNIVAAFFALLSATNFEYFGGEATYEEELDAIMADGLPHTIGNVTYTYTDTRPIFKIVSLNAEPAE